MSTRGAVDRLASAAAEWAAVHRARDEEFGPSYWQRPRDALGIPEYAAWSRREQAAARELQCAREAWWDGAPGEQLDLFGAAS